MSNVVLSPRESEYMRNALGWSSGISNLGYRNYFCVSKGDFQRSATWDGLVSRGLAYAESGGRAYCVTANGLDALGAYGLTITKRLRDACPAPSNSPVPS